MIQSLVVLATIHPIYRDETLCQGVWQIDTVTVPFICPCIMVQVYYKHFFLQMTMASKFEIKIING